VVEDLKGRPVSPSFRQIDDPGHIFEVVTCEYCEGPHWNPGRPGGIERGQHPGMAALGSLLVMGVFCAIQTQQQVVEIRDSIDPAGHKITIADQAHPKAELARVGDELGEVVAQERFPSPEAHSASAAFGQLVEY